MATYGISDLHLSFGCDKPMTDFGSIWNNYENKIKENWISKVKDTDTIIIAGDISWGTHLTESIKDFKYISNMPGNKIILRGNHDYYFDTKTKLESFLKTNNFNNIHVLYNNCIDTDEYIVCGTRGWGKTESEYDDDKIIKRECIRLKLSLDMGAKLRQEYKEKGIDKKILVAIHFPPFEYEFSNIMEEYNVYKCIYGHLHGY
ncbi:MAG: metallophosphoesterase, partial [Clostridia bacterium]